MPLDQPRNAKVLAALAARGAGKPEFAAHDALPATSAYLLNSGCHPDVVERLWDPLGKALPQECRCLIHGVPALMHPGGLILAVGMGTMYGLRILASTRQSAMEAGAKTTTVWSGGGGMNIQQVYGRDWIFGGWLPAEPAWCRAVYASGVITDIDEPDAGPEPDFEDPATVAAQAFDAVLAALEQRVAHDDHAAKFELFGVLWNMAMKQASQPLLDRADALLSSAAAAGHGQARALMPVWPRLKAEAERRFPK